MKGLILLLLMGLLVITGFWLPAIGLIPVYLLLETLDNDTRDA